MKNFWNRKADRVLEIFQMTDEIMKAGMTSFFLHKNLLTDAILLVMLILQSAIGCA